MQKSIYFYLKFFKFLAVVFLVNVKTIESTVFIIYLLLMFEISVYVQVLESGCNKIFYLVLKILNKI